MTSEFEDDLRTTVEAIRADAERLKQIEAEKVGLDAGDPRLLALAAESSRIAERLRVETLAEEVLINDEADAARYREPAEDVSTTPP